MYWYLEALRRFNDFEGRSRRAEYWSYVLINFVGGILVGIASGEWTLKHPSGWPMLFAALLGLIAFIPGLAVSVRRLHDTNRSGWWMLISLIPLVGTIVLFLFTIQDSDVGDNDYGPNPKSEMLADFAR